MDLRRKVKLAYRKFTEEPDDGQQSELIEKMV
jgi:hypothetical protein